MMRLVDEQQMEVKRYLVDILFILSHTHKDRLTFLGGQKTFG